MEAAVARLDTLLSSSRNRISTAGKLSLVSYARHRAVLDYLRHRLHGTGKMQASALVVSSQAGSQTEYAAKAIRALASVYLSLGVVPEFCQGNHAKRKSVLSDEDMKELCLQHLRSLEPKLRSPQNLKNHIEDKLFPLVFGVSGQIAEATVRRYLRLWGFKHRMNHQAIYYDGHERGCSAI